MKAVIFAGGPIEDYSYIDVDDIKNSFVIAADGGCKHTEKLGITPNVFVGDNDSWGRAYPDAENIIICPTEKDYTDTNKAIDYAVEKGCGLIDIYGGLGGRLDHEYSNYCMLAYGLSRGVKIRLIGKNNEVTMENKPFTLKRVKKKYVSFFPFGGVVEGFSVKGLKYEAENIRLEFCEAQASSNEFSDCDIAEVSFESGFLIVMLCDDVNQAV